VKLGENHNMPGRGRPTSERGRAEASKERALAHLRWLQVREKRRELIRMADAEATLGRVLAMVRDRMLSLPDHISQLTSIDRETLRRAIAKTLEECADAEL
jgi:hypothetical protein